MRALTDEREALVGEVLRPDEPTPQSVFYPRVVETIRTDHDMQFHVRLADGGVWSFCERELDRIGFRVEDMSPGEIARQMFAYGAMTFKGRKLRGR